MNTSPLSTVNGVSMWAGGSGGFNPAAGLLHCDSVDDLHAYVRHQFGWKMDAGQTFAFARELEHIMSKVYQAKYAKYRAKEFFPINSEVDPGALSYTYRMSQRFGNAAIINNGNAKDLPNADVGGEEFQAPVVTLGVSYNFNVINQMSASMANIPLEALKADAARQAIEALEEQIFALGSSAAGVAGITNLPGMVATTKVSTGTWAAQVAAAATTAALSSTLVGALASDINAMANTIISQSNGHFEATDCLLPVNLYSLLKTIPQSTLFNSKSLLTFLEEQTGLHFDYWPILLNAGAVPGSVATGYPGGAYTRIMVYDRDPEVASLVIPQPFTQLAPQITALVWEVPCFSRIGGAFSPQPLGITYLDGA